MCKKLLLTLAFLSIVAGSTVVLACTPKDGCINCPSEDAHAACENPGGFAW